MGKQRTRRRRGRRNRRPGPLAGGREGAWPHLLSIPQRRIGAALLPLDLPRSPAARRPAVGELTEINTSMAVFAARLATWPEGSHFPSAFCCNVDFRGYRPAGPSLGGRWPDRAVGATFHVILSTCFHGISPSRPAGSPSPGAYSVANRGPQTTPDPPLRSDGKQTGETA